MYEELHSEIIKTKSINLSHSQLTLLIQAEHYDRIETIEKRRNSILSNLVSALEDRGGSL